MSCHITCTTICGAEWRCRRRMIGAGFFVAHLALDAWAVRLRLGGIDDPAGLALLLLVGGVCSTAWLPLSNALSRAHERRADRYALEITGQPGGVHLGDEAARAAESCRGVPLGHRPVALLLAPANSRARRCRPGLAHGGDDA